jgi:hypothetical protein
MRTNTLKHMVVADETVLPTFTNKTQDQQKNDNRLDGCKNRNRDNHIDQDHMPGNVYAKTIFIFMIGHANIQHKINIDDRKSNNPNP